MDGSPSKQSPQVYRLKSDNWKDLREAITAATNGVSPDNRLEIEIAFVKRRKKTAGLVTRTCLSTCYRDLVQNAVFYDKKKREGESEEPEKTRGIRTDLDALLRRLDLLEERLKLLHDGLTGYSTDGEDAESTEKNREMNNKTSQPIEENEQEKANSESLNNIEILEDPVEPELNSNDLNISEPELQSMDDVDERFELKTDYLESSEKESDQRIAELVRTLAEEEKNTRDVIQTGKKTDRWEEHIIKVRREHSRDSDDSSDNSDSRVKERNPTNVFMVQTNVDFSEFINNYEHSPKFDGSYIFRSENRSQTNDKELQENDQLKPGKVKVRSITNWIELLTRVSNKNWSTNNEAKQREGQIKYKLSFFTRSDNKNFASIYNIASTKSVLNFFKFQTTEDIKFTDFKSNKEQAVLQNNNTQSLSKSSFQSSKSILHKNCIQNESYEFRGKHLAEGDCTEDTISLCNGNTEEFLLGQISALETPSTNSQPKFIHSNIHILEPRSISSLVASGSKNVRFRQSKSRSQLSQQKSQTDSINYDASILSKTTDINSDTITTSDQQLIKPSDLLNNQTIEFIVEDLRNAILEQMQNAWAQCLVQINDIVENKLLVRDSPL